MLHKLKKIFYRVSGNNFEELLKLKVGNTASLMPYYKLIVSEGVKIMNEPLVVIGNDKFYAEKVYLKNAIGKVFWINIAERTFKGVTFSAVEVDTFKITTNVDKTNFNLMKIFGGVLKIMYYL